MNDSAWVAASSPSPARVTYRRIHRRWPVLVTPLVLAMLLAVGPALGPQKLQDTLANRGVYSNACTAAQLHANGTCAEQQHRIQSAMDTALYIGVASTFGAGVVIDFFDGHSAAFLFSLLWAASTGCTGVSPTDGVVWSALTAIAAASGGGLFVAILLHHLRVLFPDPGNYALANACFTALMTLGSFATVPLRDYLGMDVTSLLVLYAGYGGVVGLPLAAYALWFPRRRRGGDVCREDVMSRDAASVVSPKAKDPAVWDDDDDESLAPAIRSRSGSVAPSGDQAAPSLYSSIDKHNQFSSNEAARATQWTAVARHDGSKSVERGPATADAAYIDDDFDDDAFDDETLGGSRRRLASSHREALVLTMTGGSTSLRKRSAARCRVTCHEAWAVVTTAVFWACCFHVVVGVCLSHYMVSAKSKLLAIGGQPSAAIDEADSLSVYFIGASGTFAAVFGLLVRQLGGRRGLLAGVALEAIVLVAGAGLCCAGIYRHDAVMLYTGLCSFLLYRAGSYALLNLTLPTLFSGGHGVGTALGLALSLGGGLSLAIEPSLCGLTPTASGDDDTSAVTAALAVISALSVVALVAELLLAVTIQRHHRLAALLAEERREG